MIKSSTTTGFKKHITADFDSRLNYDSGHMLARGQSLIDHADLSVGDRVLDVATGTAITAIAAAEIVGSQGAVTGIDISPLMLDQARHKLADMEINNLTLVETDADHFTVEDGSFDVILCSSALMWFTDIAQTLENWHSWLKTPGSICFSCYTESSFMIPLISQAANEQGIQLKNCNEPLGTHDRCKALLHAAGFQDVEIVNRDFGNYMSQQEAKDKWHETNEWLHPDGNTLAGVSEAKRRAIKEAYDRKVDALLTEQGVWQEQTLFIVKGYKR